jgi:signal transduction histidine kinase
MGSPLAASHPKPRTAGHVLDRAAGARRLVDSIPLSWRLSAIAVLGALAAAGVAATTAPNPLASPNGIAVELRVTIVVALIAAGLYAQTSKLQERMGALLVGAGFISSLWLLNGSANRVLFSVGVVVSGVAPVLFAYLLLAHPTGRLSSRREARFLWLTGGALATLWLLGVLMTLQPPLRTPLLQCTPHCPPNAFSLGSAPAAVGVVQIAMRVAWVGLTVGTPILLLRRLRGSPVPVRSAVLPVAAVSVAVSALLAAYVILLTIGVESIGTLGAFYIGAAAAVPVAILAGLGRERLFMGQTLAEFVNELARAPEADPEILMAAALRDPSLRIAYRRPGLGTYVDSHGAPVSEFPAGEAVAWVERGGRPVAAVLYSAELSRDERFVQAAGAAAVIRLEKARLEADLKASTADMAASRVRLLEMAHAERRRLERDLHDGVQQHLVGLRIKLEMAAEAMKDDPTQGERVLASVGRQMDDILHEVRSLARGIYPSLLTERGVGEALRAAARSSPVPAEVRGRVGRYSEDVEVAVYFCCLEALQNVAKHAGPGATATVVLREVEGHIGFEVRDAGGGFSPKTVQRGSGLINMRDRIEAVGGELAVTSRRGRGTSVRGSVPIE